jgi:phosphohistidine phosphatase
MMKILILMRHAKSSWDEPGLADRDRPLTGRGRKAAPRVARELVERKLVPDLVLTSDAARARQTWDAMAHALPNGLEARVLRSLYPGSPSRILSVLAHLPADAERVLIISHNPGLETLARRLVADGDKQARAALEDKFPTAAAAVLEFKGKAWPDFADARGRLRAFLRPRELS